MARISFPERGFGEHVDWALMRPEMAVGMGALSSAVYDNTKLPLREREAARWTIALINDCVVCQDTRAKDGAAAGVAVVGVRAPTSRFWSRKPAVGTGSRDEKVHRRR